MCSKRSLFFLVAEHESVAWLRFHIFESDKNNFFEVCHSVSPVQCDQVFLGKSQRENCLAFIVETKANKWISDS